MLVLTRKLNEAIVIGDSAVTVTVVDVKGGRVRLGVNAPAHVRINRVEPLHTEVGHASPHEALASPTVTH